MHTNRDQFQIFCHSVSECIFCACLFHRFFTLKLNSLFFFSVFFLPWCSVDGGVSKNDFICQLLADLTKLKVERAFDSELSALGAGFLAGLRIGIWSSRDELVKLRKVERVFVPNESVYERSMNKMKNWERAVNRFKGWYQP